MLIKTHKMVRFAFGSLSLVHEFLGRFDLYCVSVDQVDGQADWADERRFGAY